MVAAGYAYFQLMPSLIIKHQCAPYTRRRRYDDVRGYIAELCRYRLRYPRRALALMIKAHSDMRGFIGPVK